jgi:hypothetical protein
MWSLAVDPQLSLLLPKHHFHVEEILFLFIIIPVLISGGKQQSRDRLIQDTNVEHKMEFCYSCNVGN